MAAAIRDLLGDGPRRRAMGRRGRARIRERFTWDRFMEEFLDVLQTNFHFRPSQRLKVSVIVPNYRHEAYLEERLQSIFDQTLPPHEIIVLDDASPDDSVALARGLSRHSPVPVQIVVNEKNCGSTFLQWMRGLSLAAGDLVWIAESDDSAHPLFLERLVPEFFDPEVALAYCQSALVGPHGERLADDFLAHTDDICATHWRGRFSSGADHEVELSLSQKNTIPNASAVVFRRPLHLDFADELKKLKFAGDWLFYAMVIRGRKVNYIPEVLNFYRRHESTVTHRSVRDDSQALESLHVKARIIETYPVSPNAITRSLARSVFEYNELTERFELKRPALTENHLLAEPLGRIRSVLESRLKAHASLRVLLVLDDMEARDETYAAIELANTLAREHTVFLCNAQPHLVDPGASERLSSQLLHIEGTIGPTPWSLADGRLGNQRLHRTRRRPLVLGELIRLLRIDVVHSCARAAHRLMLGARAEGTLPWVIDTAGLLHSGAVTPDDPELDRLAATMLNEARWLFLCARGDLERLEQRFSVALAEKPHWVLEPSASPGELAAACAEAYLELRNLLAFPRETDLGDSTETEIRAAARKRA